MNYLLEVCVDSVESARYAEQGGADRLELCGNLLLGGTSPSIALIEEVQRQTTIPIHALLRPRFGDFCWTDAEKRILLREVALCREQGIRGVVIGALTPDGALDLPFLRDCVREAGELQITLHRAFDVSADPFASLEQAVALGIDTILTSGQRASALEGIALLEQLVKRAAGRLQILAGSGVGVQNILQLAQVGITQFHLSGKRTQPGPMRFRREGIPMGFGGISEFDRLYTDPAKVREVRSRLNQLEAGNDAKTTKTQSDKATFVQEKLHNKK